VRAAVLSTGRDRTLLHLPDAAQVVGVPPVAAEILRLCHGARLLDEHAAAIMPSGRLPEDTPVRPVLGELVSAGLLRPLSEAIAAALLPELRNDAAPTTVGIVTADRPKMLSRCLGSLIGHTRRYGHQPSIVVIDGSRDPKVARQCRRIARRFACAGDPVMYRGRQEAAQLREALARAGLDSTVFDDALLPGPVGRNRNLLLLLTAGEHVLMLDDDVRCETWTDGAATAQISFRGHGDGRRARYLSTRAEALASLERSDVDLLAAHGTLLGRSMAELAAAAQTEPDFHDACVHLLTALTKSPAEATVRVTMAGLAGDAGVNCAHRLLFSSGATLESLTSPEALATALASREVQRIAPGPIVTHEPACMAYCMGLSNREVLPPFMPVGRNEDGVFAAMLAFCRPNTLFGHVPVGILHDSDRPSAYDPDVIPSASHVRIADVVLVMLQRIAAAAGISPVPHVRTARLADAFIDLGTLNAAELAEFVTQPLLEARCREIARLDAALATEKSKYPPWWPPAFERYRDVFMRHVTEPGFFVPIEFRGAGSIDAGWKGTQGFLVSFGRLLKVWPDVVARGREEVEFTPASGPPWAGSPVRAGRARGRPAARPAP
jgi:hypothetical protein